MKWVAAVTCVLAAVVWPARAFAVDLGDVGRDKLQLDLTETSIVAQHFDARGGEAFDDNGWGDWVNRLNATLRWGRWTAGLRLDSALYRRRPAQRGEIHSSCFGPCPPGSLGDPTLTTVITDNESRYKDSLYPAKLWLTYATPSIEVTAGDAYVQFGRGLTLSMRKIDELGIDTTLRGAKVLVLKDPFAFTAVAGFANPSRVDEATGRALFPTTPYPGDRSFPLFGSDRIVGAEVQAGRGLPVTLSTHAVRFTRCAPYPYDAAGFVSTDFASNPGAVAIGSCDARDTALWLQSLPNTPALNASEISMAGQSLEVPTLGGHGKLYLEAAVQQRTHDTPSQNVNRDGNALYGSLEVDVGKVTSTLEWKSNRNFYPVSAAIRTDRAGEFSVIAYSFLPPEETLYMTDTEGTGFFNSCVDGGRLRTDYNASDDVLLWAQGVYAFTKSEHTAGGCDDRGRTITSLPAAQVQDRVWDGIGGVEWYFDSKLSRVFATAGVRDDTKQDGGVQYRERHVRYTVEKHVAGPWSVEIAGWHRNRRESSFNIDPIALTEGWWVEGENYMTLKMAPKWVLTQGFEYTTQIGQPTYYFNGAVLYKFTSGDNVRVFVGQQRGAFRCASGVCRFFPPFEGARAELTLRF